MPFNTLNSSSRVLAVAGRRPALIAAAVACAASLSLIGVAPALAAATKATGSSTPLVVDDSTPPSSLSPIVGKWQGDDSFYSHLIGFKQTTSTQDGVQLSQDDTADLVPELASSWSISKNGLTYTFDIRHGVVFPSGDKLTAQDVVYTFKRSYSQSPLELGDYTSTPNIASISSRGNYTVIIKLKRPSQELLLFLAQSFGSYILDSKYLIKEAGTDYTKQDTWLGTHSAGVGPYVISSYQPGVKLVLKANKTWYGTPPVRDTVDVNFITDQSALLLRAKDGAADVTLGLSAQNTKSLASSPTLHTVALDLGEFSELTFPVHQPGFSSVDFRKALALAIPYASILKNVIDGYGSLFQGPLTPNFPQYDAKAGGAPTTNLTEAKKLIAASGVSTPITVTLDVANNDANSIQVASILQAAWSQLGVTLNIDQLSPTEFVAVKHAATPAPVMTLSYTASLIQSAPYMSSWFTTSSPVNPEGFSDPSFDALQSEASSDRNPKTQQKLWDEVTAKLVADQPAAWLHTLDTTVVLAKSIKHFGTRLWAREYYKWG